MRHAVAFSLMLGLALPAVHSLAAEPVLEQVLLSTSGVGYLGWRAEVGGDGRLQLTVPLRQVDDVLKSLTVLDGEGNVGAVSLLGPAPLADLFRGVPFGEADLDGLPALLARLRGAEIEVRGTTTMVGRLVAVVPEEVVAPEGRMVRHRLSLLTERGLRSALLEEVDAVALVNPELQQKVELVLSRLAEGQIDQERELAILLPGAEGRTVRLGYLAEMPLWKASYRLIAGDGQGLLQGWAILENLSGHDWDEVAVTLIAGSPTALRQELFQSYFVPRPELPVLPAPEPLPSARAAAAAPLSSLKEGVAGDDAGPPAAAALSRLDVAAARELTAQTLFELARPVSLPTGHTVMAPLVDRSVPVERIALYQAGSGRPHPQAALRVRNASDASLPPGIVTLYEELAGGGLTFLGDAALPAMPPEAEELLSYGWDGNIEVDQRQDSSSRITQARIVDGVLELTRVEQQSARYAVSARFTGAPRSFVLEQPVPPGWRLVEPADGAIDRGAVRIERALPPQGALDLAIVTEQPVSERIELLDVEPERLLLLLEGAGSAPAVRDALQRLQALSATVIALDERIEENEARRGERIAEQERLRENLGVVPPESDLARRYLDRLGQSEDELTALAADLQRLRAERQQALEARRDFLRGLRI